MCTGKRNGGGGQFAPQKEWWGQCAPEKRSLPIVVPHTLNLDSKVS